MRTSRPGYGIGLAVVFVCCYCTTSASFDCSGLRDNFIPVAAPITSVRPAELVSTLSTATSVRKWRQLDALCAKTHLGYNLLQEDYSVLTSAEKLLCGDEIVPLGIKLVRNSLVWWSKRTVKKESVNAVDLERMRNNTDANSRARVAALNITTATWWLVDEATTFRCALCQRASLTYLNTPVSPLPPNYFDDGRVYDLRVAPVTNHIRGENDGELSKYRIAQQFNVTTEDVHLLPSPDQTEFHYHIVMATNLSTSIGRDLGGYKLTSVGPCDLCPAGNTTDARDRLVITWPETRLDKVVEIYVVDPRTLFTTRECGYDAAAGRASWTIVSLWDNPKRRCLIAEENRQRGVFREWLHNATATPLLPSQLGQVFVKLDSYLYFLDDTSPVNESDYTFTVLDDLEKILIKLERTPDFVFNQMGANLGLLVAEPAVNPVVGFLFDRTSVANEFSDGSRIKPIRSIDVSSIGDSAYQSSELTMLLSESFRNSRVAFSLIKYVDDTFPIASSGRKRSTDKDVLVQIVITDTSAMENMYFDIFLERGRPLFWSNGDWVTDVCNKTESVSEVREVHRCPLARNGSVVREMFYVSYADDILADILNKNPTPHSDNY